MSQLMAGIGEPGLIVDGEASPYSHVLTAEQGAAIGAADLIVWVGPELEGFLERPLRELSGRTRVIELLDSPELKVLSTGDGERRDPWFWLDSRNALILLDELAGTLMAIDPERADRYRENRARALEAIAAVDRELEYRYRDVSAAPVALYHGTQRYFEQAYAASATAQVADDPGLAPQTGQLLKARARMQAAGVRCLLVEAGLPTPNLELLTGDPELRIGTLDSLGSRLEAGPGLYVQLMRANFDAIRDCIGVKPRTALPEIRSSGHKTLPAAAAAVVPGRLSGRFLLLDQTNEAVTNADFHGSFQLITFGYTSCPDVCPTSLSLLAAAMQRLGERAERIQPIFITVDPARDTPEVLGRYVAFFHPRLLGLSGPKKMVDRVVDDFGARYEMVAAKDGDYTVDHTAGFYLFGPNGDFLDKLPHGLTARQLTERLESRLSE
jgi:protein SCO1/2